MNTSLKILQYNGYLVEKIFRVPSKSEPGTYHIVEMMGNRTFTCNCIAGGMNRLCRHIKIVMKHMLIKYPPEACWFCTSHGGMEEHHLIKRSSGGIKGPTVYLCHSCHSRVHSSNWFYHHLQKLWTKTQQNK